MPRGAVTQTRAFAYNNGPRLASATNPENGTVQYTYKSDAYFITKTDAKNQVVEYMYDARPSG